MDNDCDGMVDESCGNGCTTDDDCAAGEYCEITSWCDGGTPTDPSGVWCAGSGVCKPFPNPPCRSDADCASGESCVFPPVMDGMKCCMPGEVCPMIYLPCEGTCVAIPNPVCWADSDCPAGMRCENDVDCGGMGADCVGPFQCVPAPLPDCRAVKPGSHGACEMFLGWAFDGVKCFAEGGCGCGADCGFLFKTEAECQAACYLLD
jgi:Cys-rich repeat protein